MARSSTPDDVGAHRWRMVLSGALAAGVVIGIALRLGPSAAPPPVPASPASPTPGAGAPSRPVLRPAADALARQGGGDGRAGAPREAFRVERLDAASLTQEGAFADGLAAGPEGLRLATPWEALNPRRVGTLTSAPIRADFPVNAVSPLWRAATPEGTAVTVDMSLSQDGETWTPWYPAPADPDAVGQILPTFPDGSPNPSYGFIPGGILTFGLHTFPWIRYRLTLGSEVEASPGVSELRFFFLDTTQGQRPPDDGATGP